MRRRAIFGRPCPESGRIRYAASPSGGKAGSACCISESIRFRIGRRCLPWSSQVLHDLIENTCGFSQILFDEPGVDHGGFGIIMTEILLHIPQGHPGFQKMGGITVPEMPYGDFFVNTGRFFGFPESDLNACNGNGDVVGGHFLTASSGCRKDPDGISVHFVECPEDIKSSFGQWDIPVFIALALMDMNEHAIRINVGDFKACPFSDPKTEGVNNFEASAVMGKMDLIEDGPDFIAAQDDRKLLLFRRWV